MLKKRIVELEQSFEAQEGCFEFNGQTFDAYSFIKPYIFSGIQLGAKPESGSKSLRFQLKQLFSGIALLFSKCDTLIFSNSLERRMVKEGVIDKTFHPIEQKLGKRAVVIETKIPGNHFSKAQYVNKRVCSRSVFFLLEVILTKLIRPKYPEEFVLKMNEFMETNKLNFEAKHLIRKGLAQYLVFLWFLRLKKNVSQIFLTVYYTNVGLIMAARQRGIKVIEHQHGVINEQHYGYYFSRQPAVNFFPDSILVYGESDLEFFEKQVISSYLKPYLLGSYILTYFESSAHRKEDSIKTVAISLQDCETGIVAYQTFLRLAELNGEWKFVFKRRRLPREYYEQFPPLPKNAFFEEELNIYELISQADVHLTAYSSCALEANTLGVGNLLYNLNNKAKDYYSAKIKSGPYNQYADDLEELNEKLNNFPALNSERTKEENTRNFSKDYQRNLANFLSDIV